MVLAMANARLWSDFDHQGYDCSVLAATAILYFVNMATLFRVSLFFLFVFLDRSDATTLDFHHTLLLPLPLYYVLKGEKRYCFYFRPSPEGNDAF